MSRLNWQLHFGEPPKWSSDVKFILVDVAPTERDARKARVVLTGDAGAVARQLLHALDTRPARGPSSWERDLAAKVGQAAP